MPIHDLGYRGWSGTSASGLLRCWTIAFSGIKVAARNKWLRRTLILAWIPTLIVGGVLFGYEQALKESEGPLQENQFDFMQFVAEGLLETDVVVEGLRAKDPGEGRHATWSWILCTFLRLPQAGWTMLVVGMLAPPLIARDIRSKAFLLYFSRPISNYEYVVGKVAIVSAYIAFITTLPALGCYVVGLMMSSDFGAILDTWDIPLRIIVASIVFIIPAVSVALMFSSLTSESRFAAFAWFTTWVLGAVAWQVIYAVLAFSGVGSDATQRYEVMEKEEGVRIEFEEKLRGLGLSEQEILKARIEVISVARGASERGSEFFEDERFSEQEEYVDKWITIEEERNQIEQRAFDRQKQANHHPAAIVSLYDTLVRVQRWVFGLEEFRYAWPAMLMAVFVTIFSWIVMLRRVIAPIRI